jgi:hypothetical protein
MSVIARNRILVAIGGGVLVGGALVLSAPRVICQYSGARWVKARADIGAIEEAIERYRVDHGSARELSSNCLQLPATNLRISITSLLIPGDTRTSSPRTVSNTLSCRSVQTAPWVGTTRMPTSPTTPRGKIGPNKPLQPRRAAQPYGQRQRAESGPRG